METVWRLTSKTTKTQDRRGFEDLLHRRETTVNKVYFRITMRANAKKLLIKVIGNKGRDRLVSRISSPKLYA